MTMRILALADFQATGWRVSDATIGALVNGILSTQEAVFEKYGITENMHIVHLMAQLSHESGHGTEMTESLNYSSTALLSQWPTHFSQTQATAYGRTADHPADQKMIGALAYGGRMGNAPAPSEDGYNYRGRGYIQTTGRNGYKDLAALTGLDLVASPELVNDPVHAFGCAVAEFVNYPGMLKYCMEDNLLAVSALINCGHLVSNSASVIGYADRQAQLALWKHQYGL